MDSIESLEGSDNSIAPLPPDETSGKIFTIKIYEEDKEWDLSGNIELINSVMNWLEDRTFRFNPPIMTSPSMSLDIIYQDVLHEMRKAIPYEVWKDKSFIDTKREAASLLLLNKYNIDEKLKPDLINIFEDVSDPGSKEVYWHLNENGAKLVATTINNGLIHHFTEMSKLQTDSDSNNLYLNLIKGLHDAQNGIIEADETFNSFDYINFVRSNKEVYYEYYFLSQLLLTDTKYSDMSGFYNDKNILHCF